MGFKRGMVPEIFVMATVVESTRIKEHICMLKFIAAILGFQTIFAAVAPRFNGRFGTTKDCALGGSCVRLRNISANAIFTAPLHWLAITS